MTEPVREATNAEYVYPSYWEPMTQNISNYAANIPSQIQGTYNNWFGQNLSAGFNPNLNKAFQNAGQSNPWTPTVNTALTGLQQSYQPLAQQAQNTLGSGQSTLGQGVSTLGGATPYLRDAASMYKEGSQYDPSQLQQYLNPYTQDAANATMTAANRNLNENVLPQVNSTFAGAGQFGSTRNADFTNRAVRDNQSAVAEALGKLNYGAYQTANQNYSDWANKDLTAAQGTGNLAGQQAAIGQAYGSLGAQYGNMANSAAGLGTNQINYANALAGLAGSGSTLDQQSLTNLMSTGQYQQGQEQANIDRTYQDWMTRQKYPTTMLGGLGQMVGQMSSGVRPNVYSAQAPVDSLTKALGAAQIMSSSLSDASIQKLLAGIWE